MSELKNFTCTACGREFMSTREDVDTAGGSVNRPAAPWKQIGNLLDAWEQVNNDFKCQLQDDFPHLYRALEQLLITVALPSAPDTEEKP